MRGFIRKVANYFEEVRLKIALENSNISEPVISFVEYVKQHKSKFYFIEKDKDSYTWTHPEQARRIFKRKLEKQKIPKKLLEKILLCYDQENHPSFGSCDGGLGSLFDLRNKKLYYFEVYTSFETIRKVSDNIAFLNDDERRFLYRELYPIFLKIKEGRNKKKAEETSLIMEKFNKEVVEKDNQKRQELKEIYCKKVNTK